MENNVENSIDLKELFLALLKHARFIIIVTLIFTIGAFGITKFFLTEKFTASAQVYVDTRNTSSADTNTNTNINYNDLNAAEKLVSTCQILFTGDRMAECVVNDLKNIYNVEEFSVNEIKSMINVAAASEGTSVMNISVVSEDAETSAVIANIVLNRANEVYQDIVEGGVVKTVNNAVVPERPSSPNTTKNLALGFALGFVFSCGVIIILELIDTKIKPTDDLQALYGIPLFAEILDFDTNVKGGY